MRYQIPFKITFLLSFLLFAYFTFFLFPSYQAELSKIAGTSVQLLDLHYGYSLEEVRDLFTKIKAEGRSIHQHVTGFIDMLYPLVYGSFFLCLLFFLLRKAFPTNYTNTSWRLILFLPLLLMFVDYFENFNTLKLLGQFPELQASTVQKGSFLTLSKHLGTLTIVGMALFLGRLWYRR